MSSAHGFSAADHAAVTRRVTLLAVATAAVLVFIKLGAWQASGSVAVLASMADSALDLVASLITFYAVRYAAKAPDAGHRFGHGKAEAFASLIQAGLVFASAALVGQEALRQLFAPQPLRQEAWGIAVMVVSIVLTGALIAAQTQALRATRSVAVESDRAHYASDLASNLLALGGISASAIWGYRGLDALGGLAVAALLLWGAISVFRKASEQLMDHELSEAVRKDIVERTIRDPRLTSVHQLRTRASGPHVHIQMHVDMDPDLSLDAAHQVVVEAEKRILEAYPSADIIIHADPRGRAEPHGGGAFRETSHSETE